MELQAILGNLLFATGGLGLFFWLLYRGALWARRRASGAYVLGAFLVPIGGIGNVGDPDFKIIDEARQIKREADDDVGDPSDDDSRQAS